MGESTKISWTNATFNLAWGCTKVSPGCAHCYADSLSSRYGYDIWGASKSRRTFGKKHWMEPVKWNAQAAKEGQRRKVFSSSMCDIFEDHPTIAEELKLLWPLIRATPWLDWQLLTKRPERIAQSLPLDWDAGYANVWLGTSVEDQKRGQERVPFLLEVPSKIRFLSVEPMLGPVVFDEMLSGCWTSDWSPKFGIAGISWVIFGGESGTCFRPCDPNWIKSGVNQCQAASVPAFVKQASGRTPGQQGNISDDVFSIKQFPNP